MVRLEEHRASSFAFAVVTGSVALGKDHAIVWTTVLSRGRAPNPSVDRDPKRTRSQSASRRSALRFARPIVTFHVAPAVLVLAALAAVAVVAVRLGRRTIVACTALDAEGGSRVAEFLAIVVRAVLIGCAQRAPEVRGVARQHGARRLAAGGIARLSGGRRAAVGCRLLGPEPPDLAGVGAAQGGERQEPEHCALHGSAATNPRMRSASGLWG